MPLILDKENEEMWLDPKLSKTDIKSLLEIYPTEKMDAYPMDKDFIHRITLPNKQGTLDF